MPKTQNSLKPLTAAQALLLRDKTRTAQARLRSLIEADLRVAGIDPATYAGTCHRRNEEYLELADTEADLNELLAERF